MLYWQWVVGCEKRSQIFQFCVNINVLQKIILILRCKYCTSIAMTIFKTHREKITKFYRFLWIMMTGGIRVGPCGTVFWFFQRFVRNPQRLSSQKIRLGDPVMWKYDYYYDDRDYGHQQCRLTTIDEEIRAFVSFFHRNCEFLFLESWQNREKTNKGTWLEKWYIV